MFKDIALMINYAIYIVFNVLFTVFKHLITAYKCNKLFVN